MKHSKTTSRPPNDTFETRTLVIKKGSNRAFVKKTTIKLVLFRSIVAGRNGWNRQQTLKTEKYFFFYYVTGEGFNFNFIVTVKRMIIFCIGEAQYCLNLL